MAPSQVGVIPIVTDARGYLCVLLALVGTDGEAFCDSCQPGQLAKDVAAHIVSEQLPDLFARKTQEDRDGLCFEQCVVVGRKTKVKRVTRKEKVFFFPRVASLINCQKWVDQHTPKKMIWCRISHFLHHLHHACPKKQHTPVDQISTETRRLLSCISQHLRQWQREFVVSFVQRISMGPSWVGQNDADLSFYQTPEWLSMLGQFSRTIAWLLHYHSSRSFPETGTKTQNFMELMLLTRSIEHDELELPIHLSTRCSLQALDLLLFH